MRVSSRSSRPKRRGLGATPYVFIAPFFIIFAITGLFPLVYTGWVSLHDWHLIGGQQGFVGFENFAQVIQQPTFWIALRNTFSIFVLSSVPQIILAIFIAYMLDANLRARTFWRMGVLLPYVVAPVAVSIIFSKLFADESGVVNAVLTNMGASAIGWHSDAFWAHIAIASMVNFRWTGYNSLILLAAMQAIPKDLYEAATVDGAGRMRQFFSVTIPQLRATLIFVIINSTIGGLQIFDEPRMYDQIGKGGNDDQWLTLTMYLYDLAWGDQKSLGRGSAVALILFVIILLFALLSFSLTRRIASSATPTAKTRGRGSRRPGNKKQLDTAAKSTGVEPGESAFVPEGALE